MKKTQTKINNFFENKIFVLIVLLIVVAVGYYFFTTSNPVKAELSEIQKIAKDYKEKNGSFGFVTPGAKNLNCFSGNTFLREPQMQEVLTSPDVENISCIFKVSTSTGIVEAWSVTIVKGEKAFCEDSTEDRRETPGLTTKETCIAE